MEVKQLQSDDPQYTNTQNRIKTFDEVFAPVREDFHKSGMTEAELDELLESEIKAYRDEKRRQNNPQ